MKWLIGIGTELAKKVTARQAYVLLIIIVIAGAGYFYFDRFLDYKQATAVTKKNIPEKTLTNYEREINNDRLTASAGGYNEQSN